MSQILKRQHRESEDFSGFVANSFLVLALISCLFISCSRPEKADPAGKGRTVITYWQNWTNVEGEANRRVVDAFNEAQDEIYVDFVTISEIDNKLLVAITGQSPPDVATVLWYSAHKYAAKRALVPLDDMMAKAGLSGDRYLPAVWDVCHMDGQTWCLPQTPASLALHWNKTLFEEAGLDPEHPPQTIAELDEMAEKLTIFDENGQIVQMGFLPAEPDWWNWSWGYYFGGKIWNGSDRFTIDDPMNIKAYEWVASYPQKYGRERVEEFRGGFGTFDSPENPFIAGRLAMEIQGVWMGNFIARHNPDLRYGVAPFPMADPSLRQNGYVESDVIVIPRGAKHIEEAFKFIEWTQRQDMLELLNLGQRKFSPLKEASPGFYENHPNPNIEVFFDLAKTEEFYCTPKTVLVTMWMDEMRAAYDGIWLGDKSAQEALQWVQERMQPQLDRVRSSKVVSGEHDSPDS